MDWNFAYIFQASNFEWCDASKEDYSLFDFKENILTALFYFSVIKKCLNAFLPFNKTFMFHESRDPNI